MRARFGFVLIAFIGLLAGLVVFLPARVAVDLFARPAGLQAELVHGPVWDARLFGVMVGGQRVEQLDARLDPLSLLTGRARIAFAARDATLRLDGELIAAPGGLEARAVRGAVRLDRLPGAQDLPGAVQESLAVDIARLRFEPQAGCVEAEGALRTAALIAAGARYEVELPVLEGALYCAGRQLGVAVSGDSAAVSLNGQLLIGAAGFEWRAEIGRARDGLAPVLIALGFEDNSGAWSAAGRGGYR